MSGWYLQEQQVICRRVHYHWERPGSWTARGHTTLLPLLPPMVPASPLLGGLSWIPYPPPMVPASHVFFSLPYYLPLESYTPVTHVPHLSPASPASPVCTASGKLLSLQLMCLMSLLHLMYLLFLQTPVPLCLLTSKHCTGVTC